MRVIRYHEIGEPEVLRPEQAEVPRPGPGQVLIRAAVIGVNFNAAQRRRGRGPMPPSLPGVPGGDVVGEVVETGPEVTTVQTGDLVAATVPDGAYAEFAVADARWLQPLPTHLDLEQASALGAPAQVALSLLQAGRLEAGESVLVHAAAGSIGHLAVQLAALLGAGRVIGTAGTVEKLDAVRGLGAAAAVDYRAAGWADKVRAATGGDGPDVILNGVGGPAFAEDVRLLAPFGRLVYFGTSAGPAPQVAPHELTSVKYLVGSNFGLWRAKRPDTVRQNLSRLIEYVDTGRLRTVIGAVLPLHEAAEAHRIVEDRNRIGRVLLKV